jgi:hypothetical protein
VDRLGRLTTGSLAGAAALGTLANVGPLPTLTGPAVGVVAIILLATGTCGLYSALAWTRADRPRRKRATRRETLLHVPEHEPV